MLPVRLKHILKIYAMDRAQELKEIFKYTFRATKLSMMFYLLPQLLMTAPEVARQTIPRRDFVELFSYQKVEEGEDMLRTMV